VRPTYGERSLGASSNVAKSEPDAQRIGQPSAAKASAVRPTYGERSLGASSNVAKSEPDAQRIGQPSAAKASAVRPTYGEKSFGASSKVAKSKPGATLQPTSEYSPRLRAACQAPGGTTACGTSPSSMAGPRWTI